MNQEKLLPIILAIVCVAAGVYCIYVGDLALKTISMVCGWAMIFFGFSLFAIWMIRIRTATADAWLLSSAVVSFAAGAVVWGSVLFHFESPMVVVYLIVGWGLAAGVFAILQGLHLRTIHLTMDTEYVARRWYLSLLVGVAMVGAAGYMVVANPGTEITALATSVAPNLIVGGLSILGTFLSD